FPARRLIALLLLGLFIPAQTFAQTAGDDSSSSSGGAKPHHRYQLPPFNTGDPQRDYETSYAIRQKIKQARQYPQARPIESSVPAPSKAAAAAAANRPESAALVPGATSQTSSSSGGTGAAAVTSIEAVKQSKQYALFEAISKGEMDGVTAALK